MNSADKSLATGSCVEGWRVEAWKGHWGHYQERGFLLCFPPGRESADVCGSDELGCRQAVPAVTVVKAEGVGGMEGELFISHELWP